MKNPLASQIAISICAGVVFSASAALAQATPENLAALSAYFEDADMVSGPTIVDCKLSGGAETTCYSITMRPNPKTYAPGPWCPSNISDGAEAGGIWMRDGQVHDVDGEFIANLAEFYGDAQWQLFDPETGDIRFTGSLESCEAAARPDVDPEYQNYCVQCLPEYMSDDTSITYVIPTEPQPATQTQRTNFSGSGIAYNGVRLDGPAPLDAILAAHTIAPFDDCGGHVNPNVGYHYHAATDCLDEAPAIFGGLKSDGATQHGAQIGIAMDGFQIFSHLMKSGEAPNDLDSCNGHKSEDGTYHYHAGAAGSNAILGCLTAQAGCTLNDPNAKCDASSRPPRR